MKCSTTLFLLFALPFYPKAQFVADNGIAVHTVPGSGTTKMPTAAVPQWSKEQDRINGRIPSKQLAKMRSVTDSIISYFQSSCISEGQYNLRWHGEYASEKVTGTAQMKFGAACNISDAKARLTIMANDLTPLLQPIKLNNHDYMAMPPVKSMQKNCPCFEAAGNEESEHARFWLITPDNQQMPFTVITRKEFLEEAKGELQLMKTELLAEVSQKMPVRSKEVQEAEKKAAIDELNKNYSGADLQMRTRMFLRDYHTDEEYLKANSDKATVGLDAQIQFVDSLRTHLPADELKRPAPVSGPVSEFAGFTEDAQDHVLVKLNPTFYSPYFTSEKPQLFLVSWSYDASETSSKELDTQLQEKFTASYLRSILGK